MDSVALAQVANVLDIKISRGAYYEIGSYVPKRCDNTVQIGLLWIQIWKLSVD